MAEQFKLADAVVDIITNEAGLIAGFAKAEGTTRGFVGRMGGILGTLARYAIPGGIVAGLGMIARQSIMSAEELHELSMQVGISVEDLSRLQFAGATAGIGLEDVVVATRQLSRQMVMGETELGKASKALSTLGIKSRDANGQLRPIIDVISDIAGRFQTMENGADKTSIAVELFGRSGQRMIPILNEGADGIKKLADEADRMGYTFSSQAAAAADEFSDNLAKLKMNVAAVGHTAVNVTMPGINVLTGYLLGEYAPATVRVGEAVGELATKHQTMGERVTDVLAWINRASATSFIAITVGAKSTVATLELVARSAGRVMTGGYVEGGDNSTRAKWKRVLDGMKADWDGFNKDLETIGDEGAAAIEALTAQTEDLGNTTETELANAADAIAKQNRALEISILQKKLEIAQTNGNIAAAEMYASALDKVTYQTALDSGASETLAQILMDLSKASRVATREAEARAKAERDAEEAKREAAARAREEEREIEQGLARVTQMTIAGARERAEGQKWYEDFVKASERRIVLEGTTDAARERIEVWYDYTDQYNALMSQETLTAEQQSAALILIEQELVSNLIEIDRKYADDVISEFGRIYAEQATTQRMLTDFAVATMEDARGTMADVFFAGLEGDFESFDDIVKNFFTSFKRHIAQFLADQATKALYKWVIQMAMAWAGGNSLPQQNQFASGWNLAPGMAGGGISKSGFMGTKGGGIATGPTLVPIAEAGKPEAVVPMPNGAIPVEMRGDREARPLEVTIKNILGADVLAAAKSTPDEIIAHWTADMARGGRTYTMVKQIAGKR